MEKANSNFEDRASAEFGAVAIGRNEGERLKRCLASLHGASQIVYVDSGSSDGSVDWPRDNGIDVVVLDTATPFTAARARNAGFRRLQQITSKLLYVQFVDGDCELDRNWPEEAINFLAAHPDTAAVCGRRRERFPDRSIYNWLCDREWDVPAGPVLAFSGDVMLRAAALERVGGYRDDLIAGEEPELCVRLRAAGYKIIRLSREMTLHDAAITRFSQWWYRAMRAGYAFAQGAYLHGAPPERHWVRESLRAWFWGVLLPIGCLLASVLCWPWGALVWLVYPLQVARLILRSSEPLGHRAVIAFFMVLGRFPEGVGQLKFLRDRIRGLKSGLIEYK